MLMARHSENWNFEFISKIYLEIYHILILKYIDINIMIYQYLSIFILLIHIFFTKGA